MEETSQEPLIDLNIDYDAGNILKETAKWTKFISIVIMICLVLFVLVMLFAARSFNAFYTTLMPTVSNFIGKGVVILIVLCIIILLSGMVFLLYRFSTLIKKGIEMQEQEIFNDGLNALKIYFIISGVLGILSLLSNFSTLIKQIFS